MSAGSRFFGRPRGRFFSTRDELGRIDRDMEYYQTVYGTTVDWYFYRPGLSTFDDIYDEGAVAGGGKVYDGPTRIPVLSAVPTQGAENSGDRGFATFDTVALRLSYEQARRAGLDPDLILDRESRLLDRFVYRKRVFDVTAIQTAGHFDASSTDTVLQVLATQLRPDELVDSPTFADFSG